MVTAGKGDQCWCRVAELNSFLLEPPLNLKSEAAKEGKSWQHPRPTMSLCLPGSAFFSNYLTIGEIVLYHRVSCVYRRMGIVKIGRLLVVDAGVAHANFTAQ